MGSFMKKYTEQFKLAVVKHYLTGAVGFTAVAQEHQVPRSLVRRWVSFYRLHGIDGIKPNPGCYDARFKLSVLESMWDDDLSYGQVSAKFNIRDQCAVSKWLRDYQSGGISALMPRSKGRSQSMSDSKDTKPAPLPSEDQRTREQLLEENMDLRMEIDYLKKLDALIQSKKAAQLKKRKS